MIDNTIKMAQLINTIQSELMLAKSIKGMKALEDLLAEIKDNLDSIINPLQDSSTK